MNINATLILQSIAMMIFVWFCMKFIWPPVMHALEERKKKIADGLAAAEHGKHEQELAEERAKEILREAKDQAGEIISRAEKRAAEIVEEAKEEVAELVEFLRALLAVLVWQQRAGDLPGVQEDWDILASGEELELIEELEFYDWLEQTQSRS